MMNVFKIFSLLNIKDPLRFAQKCDKIVKVILYSLLVLIPVFLAPWSSSMLDFNKQAMLMLTVFAALFVWVLGQIAAGSFNLKLHSVNLGLAALALAYLLSNIFSVFKYHSFWGWPQIAGESFISIACLAIVCFLVMHVFSQQQVRHSLFLLSLSFALVQVLGVLSLLGFPVWSFLISQSTGFNTLGTAGSLGLLAASLLPAMIIGAMIFSRGKRFVAIANIGLSLLILVILNFAFLWWLVVAGCLMILVAWISKKNVFDARWLFLPMFFLVVAAFFLSFNPQVGWIPRNVVEVNLSHKTSLDIAMQSFRASPVTGSGPGTFIYDFAKYRPAEFNSSSFWNTSFYSASSRVLTALATVGALGILAWLCLMLSTAWYAVRSIFLDKHPGDATRITLLLAAFLFLAVQTAGYFFYNSNLSLDFLYFFFIGSLMAMVATPVRSLNLKVPAFPALTAVFLFTLACVFGLGILLLEGQRYLADIQYSRGIRYFRAGNVDQSIAALKNAANIAKVDLYFNQLALFSLTSLQKELSSAGSGRIDAAVQAKVSSLLSDVVNAANVATNLNPNNVDNWSTRGYVCQNLIQVISDAGDCAVASYEKAVQLSPNNPYFAVQQGNTHIMQAVKLQPSASAEKEKLLGLAMEKFNKALELKPGYALAHFQIALIHRERKDAGALAAALNSAQRFALQDANLLVRIGMVHYQAGNWPKAQELFEQALSASQDYGTARYFLGLTYSQQGKRDQAIETFEKLLESEPGNENVQKILENLKAGRPALDGLIPEAQLPLQKPAAELPVTP